nr:MAG TPA: hypothetical protein [Bacteriophage sp.]
MFLSRFSKRLKNFYRTLDKSLFLWYKTIIF